MKVFFHRSYEFHGSLMERTFSEPLRFRTEAGEEKSARALLISGTEICQSEFPVDDSKSRIDSEDEVIQSLLTKVQSPERKEADLKIRRLLTDVQSPLFAGVDFSISLLDEDQVRISEIRESIEHARKRSQEKLTDNEQAEFDRCRRVWQQIVWSLMTSAEVRFNH